MAMLKIKRDDEVIVVAGKDKGKRGKVLKVLENGRLLVSGIQMIKKHQKPNPQAGIAGGIIVALFNGATNKADRVGFKILEDNKKIRIFKSTGEAVDA
jgi:large subunit ribosomal protein L24